MYRESSYASDYSDSEDFDDISDWGMSDEDFDAYCQRKIGLGRPGPAEVAAELQARQMEEKIDEEADQYLEKNDMEGYTRVRERISEEVINRLRVMVNKTREEMEFEDYIEQRIAKSGDDDFTLREDNLVDEVDRIMQGMMVERKDDAPSGPSLSGGLKKWLKEPSGHKPNWKPQVVQYALPAAFSQPLGNKPKPNAAKPHAIVKRKRDEE